MILKLIKRSKLKSQITAAELALLVKIKYYYHAIFQNYHSNLESRAYEQYHAFSYIGPIQ